MKKLFICLLILCLTVSLAACGGEKEKKEAPVKEKTTLAIDEIAEGKYVGELSKCSYKVKGKSYTVSPIIAKSKFKVTIKDGKMKIYNKAVARAAGTVNGVKAPRSPKYKQIASGTLTLEQRNKKEVYAEGDLDALGKIIYMNWDGNGNFTRWSKQPNTGKYHCTVSIKMKDGIPVAVFKTKGESDKRSCKLPLKLKDEAVD